MKQQIIQRLDVKQLHGDGDDQQHLDPAFYKSLFEVRESTLEITA